MAVLGVLYRENRAKYENWATLTHHSSATIRLREKLIDLGNSLALGLQQYFSVVHPMTCSLL